MTRLTRKQRNLIYSAICTVLSVLIWVLILEVMLKGSQYYGANQFMAYLERCRPLCYVVMTPLYLIYFYYVITKAQEKGKC